MNYKYSMKLFLLLSVLILSGCHTPIVIDSKGLIGQQEIILIRDSVLLMLIVVIPVLFMIVLFAWKFRAGNTKAKYLPDFHHSYILESIIWAIPIIIIAILGTITWQSTHKLDPYKDLTQTNVPPITIEAVALDWKWLFIYPQQNIATVNFVEFPINTPIRFKITADAPMNGFQIPQLGTQIYAMAGMQTQVHLIAEHAQDYFGRSTNFSGRGFSGMQFVARATTLDEFNFWASHTVKQSMLSLNAATYKELAQPSADTQVIYYSSVQPNLFINIIMQYMMPNMSDLSVDHSSMGQ